MVASTMDLFGTSVNMISEMPVTPFAVCRVAAYLPASSTPSVSVRYRRMVKRKFFFA